VKSLDEPSKELLGVFLLSALKVSSGCMVGNTTYSQRIKPRQAFKSFIDILRNESIGTSILLVILGFTLVSGANRFGLLRRSRRSRTRTGSELSQELDTVYQFKYDE